MRRGWQKRWDIWVAGARLRWLRLVSRAARGLGLRGAWNRYLARLVHETGLFDTEWYLDRNADVREDGVDALTHYVRYGDREGRQPMPLFDPAYYRAHAGRGAGKPNSLLHYCLLGRLQKVSTSAWFDVDFYLRQNRDVRRAGSDPLRHYLEVGGLEGRSPCRQFDAAFYLRLNPAVREAGLNPLIHYLKFGRNAGYQALVPGPETLPPQRQESAGDPEADWPEVPESREQPMVDLIVPVYRGRVETLRCLRSVLRARNRTPFELIVIDDASPEDDLRESLRERAARGFFTLLENPSNIGFVRTANRGMDLHPDRDVVLLNSDTEVFGDWLDRLRAAAQRDPGTGSVTPLSNNATIASYPRTEHDNPYPLELSWEELDTLAARANRGIACETPTGIGFCMYLRRECLDEVGLFDADAFGRGYGEENDLCQRALAAGWRSLIAADVFVHHVGSVSFLGERPRRVTEAMRVMARRHPRYQADVREFSRADPLAPARRNLDRGRLGLRAREKNVLIVCHNRGGGAERHVREDTERLLADGAGVYFLRPVAGASGRVSVGHPQDMDLPNLPHFQLAGDPALVDLLIELRIDCIHVHSTVDFDERAPGQLVDLAASTGARLEVEVHDYQVICPRTNLADDDGFYCGEPAIAQCNACLGARGSRSGARDIVAWRAGNEQMLRAAATVWVPDADVDQRLRRYFPEVIFSVEPHEDVHAGGVRVRQPLLDPEEPLHIAVIGAIGKVKGYDVLLECARDARDRRLPVVFSVLGYSMNDAQLSFAGVRVSGRYLESEALDRLEAMAPHAVWLPSLWPETYSYTLSLALQAGLPVFAFDIGAIARRLGELGLAELCMPLELARRPAAINARLLDYRQSVAAPARVTVAAPRRRLGKGL